jgi:predicted transcriptional regulator
MSIKKFNKIKCSQKLHNDEKVINFLKSYGKPAPPILIVVATGLSNSKCSQVLKKLCRYGILRVRKKVLPFYWFAKDKIEN